MSCTAWCCSPVKREEFERLQGPHQSTEISNKAGRTCSSSSGLVHCPDRGSEMIFKSNKGCSSSRVTFLCALRSCRHQECVLSLSLLCLPGLCEQLRCRLGEFGPAALSFLASCLLHPLHLLPSCLKLFFGMPELSLSSKPFHERSCTLSDSSGDIFPQYNPGQTHVAAGNLPGSC